MKGKNPAPIGFLHPMALERCVSPTYSAPPDPGKGGLKIDLKPPAGDLKLAISHCVRMHLTVDEQIQRIPKGTLRSQAGASYIAFKRTLRPKYWIVWRDIACGYVALLGVAAGTIWMQAQAIWTVAFGILIASVLFGFVFAYLNLFFHEAAHRNLASSEAWSDRLADWFVGIFFGQSIAGYRVVHFGHHQHHGTPQDTEHSYFDPLNVRFLVGGLLGVRAFQVARQRQIVADMRDPAISRASRTALLRGVIFNGLVLGGFWLSGYWTVCVAWTVGMLSFFPFFNALRQVLEHRNEFASNAVNYAEVAHGRVNRLFGDGLLAQTLGGAGFNRHLLHHWEPQISYTRLKELEAFLMQCDCAELLRQKQTTYIKTFFRLVQCRLK